MGTEIRSTVAQHGATFSELSGEAKKNQKGVRLKMQIDNSNDAIRVEEEWDKYGGVLTMSWLQH